MAAPTLTRRELKNVKAYFVPSGESVDAITVSQSTWPDNDPLTNYTAYQIPDVETMVQEILTEPDPFLLPSDSGGYRQRDEPQLRGLAWTCTTARTSSYMKALQFGLASPAAASTAQAPGTRGALFMDGVLLIEVKGGNGAIIERWQVWARMTLADPGQGAGPTTSRLQVRFEQLDSGNNTYVALAA